jgi:hypothetical protein
MAFDDLARDRPLQTRGVPSLDEGRWQSEDQCGHRRSSQRRQPDERPASRSLDARGVDDDDAPGREATSHLAVEEREGRSRRALIGGIAADRRSQVV